MTMTCSGAQRARRGVSLYPRVLFFWLCTAMVACSSGDDGNPTQTSPDPQEVLDFGGGRGSAAAVTPENDIVIVRPGNNQIPVAELLSNDGDGTTLTLLTSTTDQGIAIHSDGVNITYNIGASPAFGWDRFRYKVCDAANHCGEANVQLVVHGGANSCGSLDLEESFRYEQPSYTTWEFKSNDSAYPVNLTGGASDPAGDGWLRLTPPVNEKYGAAFFDQAFPAANGVSITFEAASWGGASTGGDGMVVFLVDGAHIDKSNFELGGCCGSLGYAPFLKDGVTTPGMPHAVAAVAFDHWGGFWNNNEGRTGPSAGDTPTGWISGSNYPNNVTVRGDAASQWKTLFVDQIDTSIVEMSCPSSICSSRPSTLGVGRYNVNIVITPVNNGARFHLRAYVQSDKDAGFTKIADREIHQALLPEMKLGILGSSGGSLTANHEIRNLKISSLVDAKIDVTASSPVMEDGVPITYTYVITNKTNASICAADVQLNVPDGFTITSQGCTTSSNNSNCGDLGTQGVLHDIVSLGANDTITVTITGTGADPGDGSTGGASGSVTPGGGQGDQDPDDNSSSIDTTYELVAELDAADHEVWVRTGTASVTLPFAGSQPFTITSIGSVTGGSAVVDSADSTRIVFTPTHASTPGIFGVTATACATADPTNCSAIHGTVVYNDDPVFDLSSGGSTADAKFQIPTSIVVDVGPGDVGTIDPNSLSIASGSAPSCAVSSTGAQRVVTFVAPTTMVNGDVASCFVTVCEVKPANTCATQEFVFTLNDEMFSLKPDQMDGAQGVPSSMHKSDFLANDIRAEATTFALVPNSATGGSVSQSGDIVTFTANENATAASFQYKACAVYDTSICDETTVTVHVAQKPTVNAQNLERWTRVGDPPVIVSSPFNVPTTNTVVSATDATATIQGTNVRITPANGVIGNTTTIVQGCTQTTVPACANATITVVVNDYPTIDAKSADVVRGETVTITPSYSAGAVGTINAGSLSVSGNGCTINNNAVRYSAPASATPNSTATCTVRICEDKPADTCAEVAYTLTIRDTFHPTDDDVAGAQGETTTTPVDALLNNDGYVNPTTFVLTGTPAGGTVEQVGNEVLFHADSDASVASYTYKICSVATPIQCKEDVQVIVNLAKTPAIQDVDDWMLQGETETIPSPFAADTTNTLVTPSDGSVVLNTDGSVTVTPDPAFTGEIAIEVKSCTKTAVPACATKVLKMTVNDKPTVTNGQEVVTPGGTASIKPVVDQGAVAPGVDETSLIITGNAVTPYGSCDVDNGRVRFTADDDEANIGQSAICAFEICEVKPVGACAQGVMTFNIEDVFSPTDDEIIGVRGQDSTVTIATLISNDGNTKPNSFALNASSAVQGSVSEDGNAITFSVSTDAQAPLFTYNICSGLPADTTCQDVTVRVILVDAPDATDVEIWVLQGETPVEVPSPFGPNVDLTVDTPPEGGTVSVDTDGDIVLVPDPAYVGTVNIPVTGCTQTTPPACTETTAVVVVNDLPTVQDDEEVVSPGGSVSVVPQADPGDVGDIDPSSVTLTHAEQRTYGSCRISGNAVRYIADDDAPVGSSDTCVFEICEVKPAGACAQGTITFKIEEQFRARDDEFSIVQDTWLEFQIDADLLANDTNEDPTSFVFNGDWEDGILYTDNGQIELDEDGQTYVYTPNEGFIGQDGFSYTVCSVFDAADCNEDVQVRIDVNRAPALADETVWVVTQTSDVRVDVDEFYDGDPIKTISITNVTVEDAAGNPLVLTATAVVDPNTHVVTLTPDDPSAPAIYVVHIETIDSSSSETRAEGTLTVIYNDPPTSEQVVITLLPGDTVPVVANKLLSRADAGDIDGGWDTTSFRVSDDPAGPWNLSAILDDGESHCDIVAGQLAYTLAEDSDETNLPACYVQFCELNPGPAGPATLTRACGTIEVVPVLGVPVIITSVDQTDITDGSPTVHGTAEPNTIVTITVNGQDPQDVQVDEDGTWSWTPQTPLEAQNEGYEIVATGENDSWDTTTIFVKEEGDAGDACTDDTQCQDGLICNQQTHTCEEPGDGGDDCNRDVECKDDLICDEDTQTCTEDDAQECTTDAECDEGFSCDTETNTCVDDNGPGKEGDACTKDTDCNGDLVCDPDTLTCTDNGDGDPDDQTPDNGVYVTGGRIGDCASTGTTPGTGMGMLALLAALALVRRRRS